MVDNYNVDEQFQNLFGSRKRKKELAATKAELEKLKSQQSSLMDTLSRNVPQAGSTIITPSGASMVVDETQPQKPNLLLWGGIALVVVIGGILLINRK
jgi:hypothetical protein